jgi:hypothetical protein
MRIESELGPDGRVGTWNADRFLSVGRAIIQVRSSSGGPKKTKDQDVTTAFAATSQGTTEIVRTYQQRPIDLRWYEWLLPPITERVNRKRQLQELASRCEAALRLGLAHRSAGSGIPLRGDSYCFSRQPEHECHLPECRSRPRPHWSSQHLCRNARHVPDLAILLPNARHSRHCLEAFCKHLPHT